MPEARPQVVRPAASHEAIAEVHVACETEVLGVEPQEFEVCVRGDSGVLVGHYPLTAKRAHS